MMEWIRAAIVISLFGLLGLALPQLLGWRAMRAWAGRRYLPWGPAAMAVPPLVFAVLAAADLAWQNHLLVESGSRCATPLAAAFLAYLMVLALHLVLAVCLQGIFGGRMRRRGKEKELTGCAGATPPPSGGCAPPGG